MRQIRNTDLVSLLLPYKITGVHCRSQNPLSPRICKYSLILYTFSTHRRRVFYLYFNLCIGVRRSTHQDYCLYIDKRISVSVLVWTKSVRTSVSDMRELLDLEKNFYYLRNHSRNILYVIFLRKEYLFCRQIRSTRSELSFGPRYHRYSLSSRENSPSETPKGIINLKTDYTLGTWEVGKDKSCVDLLHVTVVN